jgi:ATP-dependent Zn protease
MRRRMGEESRLTAYHEAGHMVVAWELGLNVLGATVIPDPEEGYAGRVVVPVEDRVRYADWVESERAYLFAHMVMLYAGIAAGERYLGAPLPEMNIDVGFVSPDSDYDGIADALLNVAGPGEKDQLETSASAQRIAENRVTARWSQIEAVAQTLMDRETLDERECRRVLEAVLE